MSNGVLISSSPATYLVFEISKKFMQKNLNLRLQYVEEIDRAPTKIPFNYHHARKAYDGVMVQV